MRSKKRYYQLKEKKKALQWEIAMLEETKKYAEKVARVPMRGPFDRDKVCIGIECSCRDQYFDSRILIEPAIEKAMVEQYRSEVAHRLMDELEKRKLLSIRVKKERLPSGDGNGVLPDPPFYKLRLFVRLDALPADREWHTVENAFFAGLRQR